MIDLNLLVEIAKRNPTAEAVESQRDEAREMVELLRSFYHPKQHAFYRSPHKRKATKKTRRAGSTAGGCRELLARSIETAGHRATVVHTTLVEAKARAWENDTQSGFVDIVRQYGTQIDVRGVAQYTLGGVVVEVREADHCLEFSNGSQIELIGLEHEIHLRKKRGHAKHVFWIDECQDFAFLEKFYKAVVVGSSTDRGGEVWLTGTPGQDAAGMFYEITKEEIEERLPGWEVHELAVVDNPFFGRVVQDDDGYYVVDNLDQRRGPYRGATDAEARAIEIRWENTAGKAIRENNWQLDDPDLLREWYAKWVKGDARYVYPVHAIPKHKRCYAPMRLMDNPFIGTHERFDGHPRWYDHEVSLLDLPRKPRGDYQWLFATGADFGYHPDPFALVVWAFTFELPDVFEMFSWKHTKVLPDDQRAYIQLLWDTIDNIVVCVGDASNDKKAAFLEWEQRFGISMEPADKEGKNAQEELFAGDIRRGHVHYREGSPLLHEHSHLVYLPTKPGKKREVHKHRKIVDGTVPGDHCSDAGRYAHKHLRHYLFRDVKEDPRPDDVKKADVYEEQIDRMEQVRAALELDDGYEQWGDA